MVLVLAVVCMLLLFLMARNDERRCSNCRNEISRCLCAGGWS